MRSAFLLAAAVVCQAAALAPARGPNATPPTVTFFVASDSHFGARGMQDANRLVVEQMNALPGTTYPTEIGGSVDERRWYSRHTERPARGVRGVREGLRPHRQRRHAALPDLRSDRQPRRQQRITGQAACDGAPRRHRLHWDWDDLRSSASTCTRTRGPWNG
jgi:hypothetical protein